MYALKHTIFVYWRHEDEFSFGPVTLFFVAHVSTINDVYQTSLWTYLYFYFPPHLLVTSSSGWYFYAAIERLPVTHQTSVFASLLHVPFKRKELSKVIREFSSRKLSDRQGIASSAGTCWAFGDNHHNPDVSAHTLTSLLIFSQLIHFLVHR